MRKSKAVAGAAAMCVALGLGSSLANATDICEALLSQGIRDTSSQQVTESRFNEIKSNACNSNYDTYAKASSQAMSGGLDLPGLFGISAGSATANADYSQKWTHFCQANYGAAMSNAGLKSYISTANQAVLHSFDNCVNVASEQFIRYVQPQADGKVFAIVLDNKRQGNPSFTIEGISLTISGGGTMKVQDDCDFKHQFPWNTKPLNAISIVCRKKPEDAVVVNAITDAGNIAPVTVPAVPTPGPSVADRVAALEGVVQILRTDVVPPGTIGFFENTKCPATWTEFADARGRYLVGLTPGGIPGTVVGTALRDQENRPTGAHTHSFLAMQHTRNIEPGHGYYDTQDSSMAVSQTGGVTGGAVPGTNAPYLEVLACQKS